MRDAVDRVSLACGLPGTRAGLLPKPLSAVVAGFDQPACGSVKRCLDLFDARCAPVW